MNRIKYDTQEKWHEIRSKGIGGSDAAAIAGLSRWRSPLQVWMEKTGQYNEKKESEQMYWGTRLEEVVAEEFTKRTGKVVHRCNDILQHPDHPFMLANIDRRVVGTGEKAGLECKTAGEWSGRNLEKDDFTPEHYLQCQHYLAVTGWDKWYLACLIGGQRFVWKEVLPDQQVIENLIKIESEFWKLVESNTPPNPDGSDACTNLLSSIYPVAEDKEMELPNMSLPLIEIVNQCKASLKEIETQKAEAENKLKAILQDNEKGKISDFLVIWKNVFQQRVDTKKLKVEQPEIFKQYVKESSYRRFDIKEIEK